MEREINNKVYGYLYNADGENVERYLFEGTPKNMAHFIMWNAGHKVVITDIVDNFVVSSMQGGFLDRVSYPALREEIIKEILPIQLGDIEAINVAKQGRDNPLRILARDIDDFIFTHDFYNYKERVGEDKRSEHIQSVMIDLQYGDVDPYITYLLTFIKHEKEGDKLAVKDARALLRRIRGLSEVAL